MWPWSRGGWGTHLDSRWEYPWSGLLPGMVCVTCACAIEWIWGGFLIGGSLAPLCNSQWARFSYITLCCWLIGWLASTTCMERCDRGSRFSKLRMMLHVHTTCACACAWNMYDNVIIVHVHETCTCHAHENMHVLITCTCTCTSWHVHVHPYSVLPTWTWDGRSLWARPLPPPPSSPSPLSSSSHLPPSSSGCSQGGGARWDVLGEGQTLKV